jgi:hypothetical protein
MRREDEHRFPDSTRRTFERRVLLWRSTHGPDKTVKRRFILLPDAGTSTWPINSCSKARLRTRKPNMVTHRCTSLPEREMVL